MTMGRSERRVSAVSGFVVSFQNSSIGLMGWTPFDPRVQVCASQCLKGSPLESGVITGHEISLWTLT